MIDIETLATLSRIRLSEEEKKDLKKEIASIVGYIDSIKQAPIDFDPTPRPGAVRNIVRDDVVKSCEDDLLAGVPHKEGKFVAVKKIL